MFNRLCFTRLHAPPPLTRRRSLTALSEGQLCVTETEKTSELREMFVTQLLLQLSGESSWTRKRRSVVSCLGQEDVM